MSSVLVVTNDFPPRLGGIETFTWELVRRLPARTVILGPSHAAAPVEDGSATPGSSVRDRPDVPSSGGTRSSIGGAAGGDAARDMEVIAHRGRGRVLPTPGVAREVRRLVRREGIERIWFPATAPLALLSRQPGLPDGIRMVGSTHGHEAGWAQLPVAAQLMRMMGDGLDVVTYLGEYTLDKMRPALGGRPEYVQMASGVDTSRFSPSVDGGPVRARHGLVDRQVVLCVSRLVPRKGQDMLIRAMPDLLRRCPEAVLLVAGEGPYEPTLRRLAEESGVGDRIVMAGPVSPEELPAYYAAADVFAMPCRDRQAGREVEGLGIVFLEASATGLPVVVGRSGGSVDAVVDGVTGTLVDGNDVGALAAALIGLLEDPVRRAAMGRAGREWVESRWTWEAAADRLAAALDLRA